MRVTYSKGSLLSVCVCERAPGGCERALKNTRCILDMARRCGATPAARSAAVFFLATVSYGVNGQHLYAYTQPVKYTQPSPSHLSGALTAPKLDWDDADPPQAVHSTGHYRAGSPLKPGAFSVARRDPWTLPAADGPSRDAHHDVLPAVDPAAAKQRHSMHSIDTSTPREWDASKLQEATVRLHLRGAPPRPRFTATASKASAGPPATRFL